jgi:hypothetical protein
LKYYVNKYEIDSTLTNPEVFEMFSKLRKSNIDFIKERISKNALSVF